MQNTSCLLGAYGNFGEFFCDYWWLFLLTALAIGLLIFVLVMGVKQTKKQDDQQDTTSQQTETQDQKDFKAEEQQETQEAKQESTAPAPKAKRGRPKKVQQTTSTEKTAKTNLSKTATKSTTKRASATSKKSTTSTKSTKSSTKTSASTTALSIANYHIVYDKQAQDWVVKLEGSTRASRRCATKAQALAVAKSLASKKSGLISGQKNKN